MNKRAVLRFLRNPLSAVWVVRTRLLPRARNYLRARLAGHGDAVAARQGGVVLFHIGRSGSTVLGDLLYQDRHIHWDGEVIRQFIRDSANTGLDNIVAYIGQRMALAGREQLYGCEIKPFHIRQGKCDPGEFIAALEAMGFQHFIVLERRNYLRKVVSSLIAARTERWHNSSYEKARKSTIHIEPDALVIDDEQTTLMGVLDSYTGEFDRLRELLSGRKLLWLTYEEDISENPLRAYERICRFVGLEPGRVSTRYAKTNPYPLSDLIENREEIDKVLGGTDYAWMLHEK